MASDSFHYHRSDKCKIRESCYSLRSNYPLNWKYNRALGQCRIDISNQVDQALHNRHPKLTTTYICEKEILPEY